jgi:hypothetical protein
MTSVRLEQGTTRMAGTVTAIRKPSEFPLLTIQKRTHLSRASKTPKGKVLLHQSGRLVAP